MVIRCPLPVYLASPRSLLYNKPISLWVLGLQHHRVLMPAGPLIFTEGTQSALILVYVIFTFLVCWFGRKEKRKPTYTEADLLFLSSFITGSGLSYFLLVSVKSSNCVVILMSGRDHKYSDIWMLPSRRELRVQDDEVEKHRPWSAPVPQLPHVI